MVPISSFEHWTFSVVVVFSQTPQFEDQVAFSPVHDYCLDDDDSRFALARSLRDGLVAIRIDRDTY